MARTEVKIDGAGVKGSMTKMKLPLDLIPPLFLRMIALVLMFGARKYAKNNWLKGMSWTEVATGARRHIDDFLEGQEYDKESKLPHLAHAACGLMFLIWFAYGPQSAKYREIGDDRMWMWPDNNPWEAEVERINSIDFSSIKVPAKDPECESSTTVKGRKRPPLPPSPRRLRQLKERKKSLQRGSQAF